MSGDLSSLFDSQTPLSLSFKVLKREPPPKLQPDSTLAEIKGSKTKRTVTKRSEEKSRSAADQRTVFVGNIPNSSKKKHIKCLFKEYGTIESIRFRSMLVDTGSLPIKVARITRKQLRGPLNAYIVYSSAEDAEKSLKLNGTLFGDRHLRVDIAARSHSHDHKRSVFVGNLPHEVDEEDVRQCFESCGTVEGVRVVRDAKTGIGKGFGFVTFADSSGVLFAVKQNRKLEIKNRKLRIFRSKDTPQKQFSGMKASKPVPYDKKKTKMAKKPQNKGSRGETRTSHGVKREFKKRDRTPRMKKDRPRHRNKKPSINE